MFQNKRKLAIAGLILIGGVSTAMPSLVGAAVTPVAASPIVSTSTPTGLGTASATLSGVINPEGNDTTYYFLYGLLPDWDQTVTPTVDMGAGLGNQTVTATIAGLVPNSIYSVVLITSNVYGTSMGNAIKFTTSWPIASTNGQTAINANSALLNGSVNPGGTQSSYYFQIGTSLAYGTNTVATDIGTGNTPTPASVNVGGLTPGTTYDYQLVATNGFGTSYGGNATFTAGGPAAQLASSQVVTKSILKLRKSTVVYGSETQERLNVAVSALGSVSATGAVAMKTGTRTLCTITLAAGHGSCVLSARALKVGRHSITAFYGGSSTFIASISGALSLHVIK